MRTEGRLNRGGSHSCRPANGCSGRGTTNPCRGENDGEERHFRSLEKLGLSSNFVKPIQLRLLSTPQTSNAGIIVNYRHIEIALTLEKQVRPMHRQLRAPLALLKRVVVRLSLNDRRNRVGNAISQIVMLPDPETLNGSAIEHVVEDIIVILTERALLVSGHFCRERDSEAVAECQAKIVPTLHLDEASVRITRLMAKEVNIDISPLQK
jgi:hypothetical protein